MANKNNNEVLHPYYVILSRDTRFDDDRRPAPDYIRLMDADEAISSNWVTATGERVWVVPAKDENHYITFVWGFDDYNKAELFFSLMKGEIGREAEGNDSLPWAMEKGYCAVA